MRLSVVLGIVIALGAAQLAHEVVERPLAYDEMVYAVGARAWLEDTPPTGFKPWRPLGMKVYAAPGVLAGGDTMLRALPALVTLAFLLAGCAMAREAGGDRAAIVLGFAWLTWYAMFHRGSQLLSDVPAALAGLADRKSVV